MKRITKVLLTLMFCLIATTSIKLTAEASTGTASVTKDNITYTVSYNYGYATTGNSDLNYCTITGVTIPSGTTSVTIPNQLKFVVGGGTKTTPFYVTEIGDGAFQNKTTLTTVIMNCKRCTSLGAHCFQGCTSLTTVKLPQNCPIASYGEYCFYNCPALADPGSFLLADSGDATVVPTVGQYAFQFGNFTPTPISGSTTVNATTLTHSAVWDSEADGIASVTATMKLNSASNSPANDYYILLDLSGTMNDKSCGKKRYVWAEEGAKKLVNLLAASGKNHRVTVITYGRSVEILYDHVTVTTANAATICNVIDQQKADYQDDDDHWQIGARTGTRLYRGSDTKTYTAQGLFATVGYITTKSSGRNNLVHTVFFTDGQLNIQAGLSKVSCEALKSVSQSVNVICCGKKLSNAKSYVDGALKPGSISLYTLDYSDATALQNAINDSFSDIINKTAKATLSTTFTSNFDTERWTLYSGSNSATYADVISDQNYSITYKVKLNDAYKAINGPHPILTSLGVSYTTNPITTGLDSTTGSKSANVPQSMPWTVYTLSYNGNGAASGSVGSSTYKSGAYTTTASNGYSRPGWKFTGWNTAANGTGTSYGVGASIYMGSNITLYAQWIPDTFKVHYEPNHPASSYPTTGYIADATVNVGSWYTTAGFVYSTQGWRQTGWNTAPNGTGTSYSMGAAYNNIGTTGGVTVTLYAQWEQKALHITYATNGTTYTGPTSQTVYYETSYEDITSFVPTKPYYTFYGWATSSTWSSKRFCYSVAAGGGTWPYDNTTAIVFTPTNGLGWATALGYNFDASTSDMYITLYPQMQENLYSVRYFNDQDGTYTYQRNLKYTATYSSWLNGQELDYKKRGYHVAYWETDVGVKLWADPKNENVPSGTYKQFSKLAPDNGTIVTATPVWEPNRYFIVYYPGKIAGTKVGGTAPTGAENNVFVKLNTSWVSCITESVAVDDNTVTARLYNPNTTQAGQFHSYVITYYYDETYEWPECLYTDKNKQGKLSTFKGWSLIQDDDKGIMSGTQLYNLTPERDQVITVYPTFNRYPVLSVTPPPEASYNDDSGLWEQLITTKSPSAISGTYLEEWLLSWVSEASDREDGVYSPGAHLYLSGFAADWIKGTDSPTNVSVVYTVEDSEHQIVSRELTWYIRSDGLYDILVH